MKKHALLFIIVLMLLFALPGLSEVYKDELVFGRLSPRGEVKQVVVVNAFEADAQSQVTDYGRYVSTEALSPVTDFSKKDDQVQFLMEPGRFYYQGEQADSALPWQLSLSYQLDGKDLAPEELSGASGELAIHLKVQPVAMENAQSDSMTLQITLSLDADVCTDIKAERATLAFAGGKINLVFVVLPGQGAEYLIKAQVKDFFMPDYQAAGLKMAVDAAMYQAIAKQALAGTPIEGAVGNLMTGFLNALEGKTPVSFADPKNPVRSVQFLLFGEGISKPVLKEEEPAEESKPEGVFDRLLDLFR